MRRVLHRLPFLALGSTLVLIAAPQTTQDVIANGDTRTITIHHSHTKEVTTATFRRWGSYDQSELTKLNWALRDWRRDEQIRMDPRIFDVLWEVHREVGSGSPLVVVSAYRSPETNSMLRRRSRAVAKHSQHTLGKAIDFHLPDVSMARVREIGVRLQRGGVGYYPSAYTPFVHLDVGSVRAWPRLTQDHLARLFPDGRTVHIPADGQPFPGYEVAKAEIIARGGTVGGTGGGDSEDSYIASASSASGWSFWTALFGGGGDAGSPRGGSRGILQGRQPTATQVVSGTIPGGDDMGTSPGSRMAALGMLGPQETETAAPARERAAARGRGRPVQEPTQVAAAPATAEAEPARAAEREPAKPTAPAPPRVTLVDAPLPVARPRGLSLPDTQVAAVGTLPAGSSVLAFAPQPPVRPSAFETLAALRPSASEAVLLVAAPLPPVRPQIEPAPVKSGPAPLATGAASPQSVPALQAPLVAVRHPAPPERPQIASLVAPQGAVAARPAPIAAPQAAPATLDQLFAAAAQSVPSPDARVIRAKTKAAPEAAESWRQGDQPAAASGFSRSNPNDIRTDRFSGPAVRPLPTTFIQN